jgi:magnesium transporter
LIVNLHYIQRRAQMRVDGGVNRDPPMGARWWRFRLQFVNGLINTEQNEIFKVLTIVSVVGVPPTLIASMYGMNFHNMPELGWRWGYPYGLALIALSTLLPILWFKRRGWW